MTASACIAQAPVFQVRQPRPDAEQALCGGKRLRIVARATEAFLTHGFEGAKMEDIAIAAGVGKVTIYRLFADKADLFGQCVIDAVRQMAAPLRAILTTDRAIADVLTDYAELHVRRMLRPVGGSRPFYEVARTLIGASLTYPDLARSCTEIFKASLGEPLIAYFRSQIAARRLEGDACFLAEHFTQSLFFTTAVILDPARAPDARTVREVAERTVGLFLHGCAGSRPDRTPRRPVGPGEVLGDARTAARSIPRSAISGRSSKRMPNCAIKPC